MQSGRERVGIVKGERSDRLKADSNQTTRDVKESTPYSFEAERREREQVLTVGIPVRSREESKHRN